MKRITSLVFAVLLPVSVVLHGADLQIRVAPMVTVCKRQGITGSGWAAVCGVADGAKAAGRIALIYPSHPDDWGKSGGTGLSYSDDGGLTWNAGPDNSPLPGMVDMWQDRLCNGDLITLGIRSLPVRKNVLADPATAVGENVVGISKDRGQTWQAESAKIHCPTDIGAIARPLPHIFEDANGTMFMPAYSWGKAGSRALLLRSGDRGRNWNVASTIATATAMGACGAPLTAPWLETTVARTSDSSLLAVVRTGSKAQSALVAARSRDDGVTWSPVEKVVAGPQKRIVAGKMPGLCLLPNGVLVLLTAHSKNHCRIYLSHDGTGREWSDGFIITSQGGGNTSMISIGRDQLLVFAPASACIQCWQVTIARNAPSVKNSLPPPTDVTAGGTNMSVSWKPSAGAANVAHYLITPILIKPSEANKETEIFPYAPIQTCDADTQLELGRMFSIGGTYRFEVAAVSRDGGISPTATSAEVVVGIPPIRKQ